MPHCKIYGYVADNECSKQTNKNAQAQTLRMPCCRPAMFINSGYNYFRN